jgi:hypothetical protein
MSEKTNPLRKTSAPQWHKQKRLAASPHKRADDDRAPPAIPINQRLAFRPAEFAALVGVSYVTIWRGIKSGKIDTVVQNGIKVIPRAYAVKAGYITDTI